MIKSNKDKRLALKQATDEFLAADYNLENDPHFQKRRLDALKVLQAAQYNIEY